MSTPDLALVGGRIRTLDPERPSASAVAIADGVIVAVGSDAEIRELGPAEIVDLRGAAVIPGVCDSHLHPFLGADGGVVAERDDRVAGDADRGGGRLVGVQRAHAPVDEREVERGSHDVGVPSGVCVARIARVGFQPGRGTEARRSWV